MSHELDADTNLTIKCHCFTCHKLYTTLACHNMGQNTSSI